MNARNLSRQIATSVVDALKAHGHILVVKGGSAALARELAEIMGPALDVVAPQVEPRGALADEPTSTFGDERIDQVVEDMVGRLSRALMSSDHVEDVFAEDAVIQRDIFRTVQAGLLAPVIEAEAEDRASHLTVKLDTLGYVAATVSKRADASTLRQAFERAGAAAHARFSAYNPAQREATFQVERGGPDEGLELEEAVADELTDLAEQGVVQLPTVERRVELPRALAPAEQRALTAAIDAIAEATLLRSGCAAAWGFADARTIRVTFTPLSDQDARGVDAPTSAFAREVAALIPALVTTAAAAPALAAPAEPATPPSRRKAAPRAKEAAPSSEAASRPVVPPVAAESPPAAEPAPRPAKRTAPKRAGARREGTATTKPAPARKTPASPRRGAVKTASPRSSAKRTAAKTTKPSAKKG